MILTFEPDTTIQKCPWMLHSVLVIAQLMYLCKVLAHPAMWHATHCSLSKLAGSNLEARLCNSWGKYLYEVNITSSCKRTLWPEILP